MIYFSYIQGQSLPLSHLSKDLRSVLRASLTQTRLSFIKVKLVSPAYKTTEAFVMNLGVVDID